MTQTQRRARYWDRLAGRWPSPATERRFLSPARAWIGARAVGQVLDVAAGSGPNLEHFPPRVELTAVDLSPRMIQAAELKARDLQRSVKLCVANAQRLPFVDHCFDTVVCTFSLCSMEDDAAALAEMRRVLTPGGRLLLADHVPPDNRALRAVFRLAELITVPLQCERLTRRPLITIQAMGLEVVATSRTNRGIIECVHAQVPLGSADLT